MRLQPKIGIRIGLGIGIRIRIGLGTKIRIGIEIGKSVIFTRCQCH
jgi:hypothetical protein